MSELAAQSKEMDELKEAVNTLEDKVNTLKGAGSMHSGPKWEAINLECHEFGCTVREQFTITLIIKSKLMISRKALADSRPTTARTETMLESTPVRIGNPYRTC